MAALRCFVSLQPAMTLPIDRATTPRLDADAVADGSLTNVPSDHMFVAEYADGEWRKGRIQPYGPIPMAPLALGLHYAQLVFEGMKAYRWEDDRVAVFRTKKHHERFNRSLLRMCMPEISYEVFSNAIHTLVDLDRDWVPSDRDAAYYIRPFMIASEERMGLKSSDEFLFMVVGGPFRPIYTRPLRVKVEMNFVRAARGGTGAAKCAGNYAGAMYPTKIAQQEGFDQVIWTDAIEHAYVEESGTMNLAFIINGVFVTPALTDTILSGVTRESVLTLAHELGMQVEERPVEVAEVMKGLKDGSLTEAFGIGTAASIAPIGSINCEGEEFTLGVDPANQMFRLKAVLDGIRLGKEEDRHGWMTVVDGMSA